MKRNSCVSLFIRKLPLDHIPYIFVGRTYWCVYVCMFVFVKIVKDLLADEISFYLKSTEAEKKSTMLKSDSLNNDNILNIEEDP